MRKVLCIGGGDSKIIWTVSSVRKRVYVLVVKCLFLVYLVLDIDHL